MRLNSPTLKLFVPIVILIFGGCNKINVFEKYHKSVVMIYNESLNRLKINNETIYFTYDKENNRILEWTENEQEGREHAMADFGTGFFCDADGKIATNKHVVYDWFTKDESSVRQIVRSWMENKSVNSGYLRDSANSMLTGWNSYYYSGRATTQDDIDRAKLQMDLWRDSVNKYNEDEKYWEGMLSALSEAKFDVETIFLGYAMDGSYATKSTDFKECQILTVSDNDDIDLAIIQPLDKKLPAEVTSYLNLNNIDENYELKVGDAVSLIGYNRGPDIAASKQGLQVQQNAGNISQQSNGFRVLYSIPILPGSSGSPVFDKDGNLVAVNYAAAVNTQSFNYGILAKHLKALAKKIQ